MPFRSASRSASPRWSLRGAGSAGAAERTTTRDDFDFRTRCDVGEVERRVAAVVAVTAAAVTAAAVTAAAAALEGAAARACFDERVYLCSLPPLSRVAVLLLLLLLLLPLSFPLVILEEALVPLQAEVELFEHAHGERHIVWFVPNVRALVGNDIDKIIAEPSSDDHGDLTEIHDQHVSVNSCCALSVSVQDTVTAGVSRRDRTLHPNEF